MIIRRRALLCGAAASLILPKRAKPMVIIGGSGAGPPPIPFVHAIAVTSDTTNATTTAINTTGKNLLVAYCSTNGSANFSTQVTDSAGNSWGSATDLLSQVSGSGSAGWANLADITPSPLTGSSYTITFSGSGQFPVIGIVGISGATSNIVGHTQANSATATTVQAPSLSSSAGDLLLCMVQFNLNTSISVDSGFTIIDQGGAVPSTSYGGAIAYKISTGAAESPTWTVSTNTDMAVILANWQGSF